MSEQRTDAAAQKAYKSRKVARKRVVLRGKIFYGDNGSFSIDCFIRDITEKGARISVERGVSMPMHVHLLDITNGIAYAAEVVWIKAPLFGLNFLRSYRMAEANEPSLKYIKQCWTNCAR